MWCINFTYLIELLPALTTKNLCAMFDVQKYKTRGQKEIAKHKVVKSADVLHHPFALIVSLCLYFSRMSQLKIASTKIYLCLAINFGIIDSESSKLPETEICIIYCAPAQQFVEQELHQLPPDIMATYLLSTTWTSDFSHSISQHSQHTWRNSTKCLCRTQCLLPSVT